MKKIITLCLILAGFDVFSQPIITSDYNPIYADTYVFKIVDDTSTAQPGQPGAGVVWNLTAMHGLLTTRQYNWKQTALTNDVGIFGANSNLAAEIVQNGFSPRYEYFQVGPTFSGDMVKVGTHTGLSIANFSTGFMQFDYPMSYGQSATDTMIGGNGVALINGRSTTTYDGHGTLQLEPQSGGNFSNVGRIVIEENYLVNYGPVETHKAFTYIWFDHTTANMTKQPIAIIYVHEWIDLNGISQREKYGLMRQILFQNSVPQLTLNASNVSVYPSPFESKITFSIPGVNSEIYIEICDLTGRVIKKFRLEKSTVNMEEAILLNDLRDGIYLAKISSEKGTAVKRIVKD